MSKEENQTNGYYIIIFCCGKSPLRDFESYFRNLAGLNEDDIQLILKQYNSKFFTYKISSGLCTYTELAEVLSRSFKTDFEIGKIGQFINMMDPLQLSSKVITLA